MSNIPLSTPRINGQEDFTGDAPPGWEVELYRGDTLIDF